MPMCIQCMYGDTPPCMKLQEITIQYFERISQIANQIASLLGKIWKFLLNTTCLRLSQLH